MSLGPGMTEAECRVVIYTSQYVAADDANTSRHAAGEGRCQSVNSSSSLRFGVMRFYPAELTHNS